MNLAEYDANGEQSANGLGFIVGFDAAVLIGDELIAARADVTWQVMETTVKTLILRNLPVVRRSPHGMAFEPIWEGRLLLSLIEREKDREPTNVLESVAMTWVQRLGVDPPP